MVHTPEIRAAVIAALLTAESERSVARRFGISRNTVRAWHQELDSIPLVAPQKKALAEQLFDYLSESIDTLTGQVRFAGNSAWLRQQSAEALAILHGVMFDKTVRLLEALQRGQDRGGI